VGRPRAASDQNVIRVKQVRFGRALHFDRVGVQELRGAAKQVDPVAAQLVANDAGFAFHDLRHAGGQIANGDAVLDDVIVSVKRAMAESGEVKNGFAQGLAGDGAAVDANAADHVVSIHHGHALAELRGGDSAFLTRGPASNYDEVVLNRMHQSSSARFTQSVCKQRCAPSRLKWHEIHSRSVYGSTGAETIPPSVVLAFMASRLDGHFSSKWCGHNSFASVVRIRENAFHREIESPIPPPSQY
jgi:hypothetical protein